MHRAAAITLVLMGGGVATIGVAGYEQRLRHDRACQAERAINPGYNGPECWTGGGSGTSGHTGGGGWHNSSSGSSTTSAATSARGGFGATGAGHAGGGE